MSIFQKSVLQKYLKTLDNNIVGKAYEKFREFYGDKERIENIKLLKEENYQEGFLREIFVQVLGYTINPDSNYNLTTEYKNQTDAKKADGAILKDEKAIGVIELKSTKTKSLEGIKEQAFNYKVNQPDCKYVITSNFQKLRFYIDNATEYEEYDLFTITENEFKEFYLILAKENLFNEIPAKLKEETKFHEENISDKFYKDYSAFKNKIFQNLIKNNPGYDKLLIFKKTQKFLDRLLFIFFAEDNGLMPPNAISRIIEQWDQLKDLEAYQPLYDRFKLLFEHLNTGHNYKSYELPAYNGGLFAHDEILDNIKIDDDVLKDDTLLLSSYDFNTDLDVNILGHIFEHSLSEIEEITNELQGEKTESTKSKRKKEGIFYTPKYITKYIVENTVGKLCQEKKEELGIVYTEIDESFYKVDGKLNQKGIGIYQKFEEYKKWLLTLKILDPACGSGAFLNTALEFLIKEHKDYDDAISELLNEPLRLFDTDIAILENNLYGVDINEESVEIAKLSLWLRTARKGRKLSILSNNIKCGNSLIDDPEVAGDKAFDWNKEFPEIMANGGFDVVIGNPPYVRVQTIKDSIEKESIALEKRFSSATRRYDLFVLFMEKSFGLIKAKGKVSYILPHKFLIADFGHGIRKFLKEKKFINKLIHFGHEIIFESASTYTCIVELSKNNERLNYINIKSEQLFENHEFSTVKIKDLKDEKWELHDASIGKLISKINRNPLKLENILSGIYQGIKNTSDKIFMMKGIEESGYFYGYSEELNKEIKLESDIMKPVAKGKDIKRYTNLRVNHYVIYPHYFNGKKTVPYEENEFKNKFPKAYNYLLGFKDFLIEKKVRFKTNPKFWYSLHRSREYKIFSVKKIVTAAIQNYPHFTIDDTNSLTDAGGYAMTIKNDVELSQEQLLSILNSKLMWFFIKNTSSVYRGGYYSFNTTFLNPFPLPDISLINKFKFSEHSLLNIANSLKLLELIRYFQKYLESKFTEIRHYKQFKNWQNLEFSDFINILNKS